MKANELQIGDFVLYNDDICIVDEIRVDNTVVLTALNTDVTSIDGNQVSVDEITPIPITAEILEKIGFVRFYVNYVNYWKMQVDNDYIELRPTEGNMAIWLDYDKDNDGIYANYILPYSDNLHELQHALRLCGIEKEIDI